MAETFRGFLRLSRQMKLKDQQYDNVLPAYGYRTLQRA
jgi:hypothetical protein